MQNSKSRQKRTFPFFFRFFSSCFRFLPHFLMNFPLFQLHEVATLELNELLLARSVIVLVLSLTKQNKTKTLLSSCPARQDTRTTALSCSDLIFDMNIFRCFIYIMETIYSQIGEESFSVNREIYDK